MIENYINRIYFQQEIVKVNQHPVVVPSAKQVMFFASVCMLCMCVSVGVCVGR